jgi:DNA adenine methylase
MKYMGSKNRISKEIVGFINKYKAPNQLYYEPFVGGGNVIDKLTGVRYGNDINFYVIELLKALQTGYDPPENVSFEVWRDVKNNKENYPAWFVGFCGICLSFGAVWFCAYSRDSKSQRNFVAEARRNVLRQAPKLKDVIFTSEHYFDLEIPSGSFIYCDPPYKGTDKYRGFEKFNSDLFFNWCSEMSKNNFVLISEFEAPKDFICVWEKSINTNMAEKILGKNITERLFVHSVNAYLL